MSEKIIHFDIRPGKGKDLDIARMFPMTSPHPVRHMSVRYFVDDMRRRRNRIDLSIGKHIQMTRFRTIPTLDLAYPEIVDPKAWQQRLLDLAPRPRTIDLVAPLDLPYDALDIRTEKPIPRERAYPDLYTRRLPYSLMMRRSTKEAKRWTRKHRRGIIGTLLTLVVTAVPTLLFVRYSVEAGYTRLLTLRDATTITEMRTGIAGARDDFERANFLWFPFSWFPGETADLAGRAIDGGRLLTRGLSSVLDTVPVATGSIFSLGRTESLAPEFRSDSADIFPLQTIGIETPTDWLDKNSTVIDSALSDMSRAADVYRGVGTGSELSTKMHDVGSLLSRGMKYLTYATAHKESLLQFLGHDEPIRYLVLNQNRDEIRANGGFPGSVIVFTLYKGNILDLRRDDVYYYDWNLYPYKEPPPPGVALLTDNYGLRDVNYYPDFHDTLEKANAFIERSGDSTITSGIAIHQGFVEDILDKTGPVSISGVTIPFDNRNFSLLMSTLVENQFAREHHPKDILFQFAKSLMAKVQEKRMYETVFDIFEKNWNDGEILFASRDPSMDATIAEFRAQLPWECTAVSIEQGVVSSEEKENSGSRHSDDRKNLAFSFGTSGSFVPQDDGASHASCSANWAYPVFTSVSGNKSDRYITRTYEAKTTKLQNCTYENVVTLSLTHTYKKTDTEKIRSYMDILGIKDKTEREKLEFIEGNGKNKSFTRLYVPRSATLAFTGADITTTENENARVYSFMLDTPVGGTTSKTLRYTVDIPQCESTDMSVEWTRQPGLREVTIKK